MKRIITFLAYLLALTGVVHAQTIVTSDKTVDKPIPSWRIAVHGGFAYQLGFVDKSLGSDMTDYQRKLKMGYCYGFDISHFFSETLGVGFKYSDGHFSRSFEGTATFDDGSSRSGIISDKIDLRFIGPFISYRWLTAKDRGAFFVNYGLGYLGLYDNTVVFEPYYIRGGTLGQLADIGYDFSLTQHLAVGASVSFVTGTISSFTNYYPNGSSQSVQLEKKDYRSLSHLTLSFGLRLLL